MSRIVVLLFLVGCGGSSRQQVEPGEPQTAKEKQYADAKASGELDDGGDSKWGKWRYTGDRKDCFFVAGRRCFKTETAACKAASCGKSKCKSSGAGPATVSCSKG